MIIKEKSKTTQNNNPEFNSKHPRNSDGTFASKDQQTLISYSKNGTNNIVREVPRELTKPVEQVKADIEQLIKKSEITKKTNFRKHSAEEINLLLEQTGFNSAQSKEYLNRIKELNKSQTNEINTPERLGMREQWIKDEFSKQLNSRNIKQDRIATIILGLPASGKSTIADPLKERMGAIEVDADIFKDYIPEYKNDPAAVSHVHEESSDLTKKFQSMAMEKGFNMVLPKVGGNPKSMEKVIKSLKDAGYTVNLTLAQLPLEKALQRDMGRYLHGVEKAQKGLTDKKPRLVPPELLTTAEGGPIATYEYCKKMCNSYGAWSTDVGKGMKPKLLEKSKGMIDL